MSECGVGYVYQYGVGKNDCGDGVVIGKCFEKSARLGRVGDKLCRNGWKLGSLGNPVQASRLQH